MENAFFGRSQSNALDLNFDSSDEEFDLAFYSSNKWGRGQQSQGYSHPFSTNDSVKSKFPKNPTDYFGHVRGCEYCKCEYHWVTDCQYAPNHVKQYYSRKAMYRNKFNKKPL